MPPAAPATALLVEHALGGVGEGENTLDPALVGQRVTAGPRRLAVGEGLLASFGERDERGGTETEFAAPFAGDEPLEPAAGAGRLDEEVQAVAVGVHPGEDVDDERDVDKAGPRRHVGEIGDPQRIGARRRERAVHQVSRPGRRVIRIVVLNRRPRTAPWSPISRISRATLQRATRMPSRVNCRQILRTPYT